MIAERISKYIFLLIGLAYFDIVNGMDVPENDLRAYGYRLWQKVSLYELLVSSEVKESDFQGIEPDCAICFEQFQTGEVITKCSCSCKEAYHPGCLKLYLKEAHSCPSCRKQITQLNEVCFRPLLTVKQSQLLDEAKKEDFK